MQYLPLVNRSVNYTVPAFVCILTLCIVFALNFIQPMVAVLTMAKASLLLGTVRRVQQGEGHSQIRVPRGAGGGGLCLSAMNWVMFYRYIYITGKH